MRKRVCFTLVFALFARVIAADAAVSDLAPEHPVTDTYFGKSIVDPYRYMETPNDPDYATWKARELAATHRLIADARLRAHISADASPHPLRLTSLTVMRDRVFFVRPGAHGSRLCVRGLHGGAERVVVSGDRYDTAAGPGSLGAFAVSSDAHLVAIHVYLGDASDSDIHILRVTDGVDVEAPLHETIFDYLGFMPGDRALLYAKTPSKSKAQIAPAVSYDYLHRIGTPQSRDPIVFGIGVSPRVAVPKGSFAFVDPSAGAYVVAEVRDVAAGGSRFYTAPTATFGRPATPWRLLGAGDTAYTDYALHGTTIDLVTDRNAPNYAVVRASLAHTFAPRVVLHASETTVVSGTLDGIPKAGIFALNAAQDADYVQLLDRGVNRIVRIPYDAAAKPEPLPLPLVGSVLEIGTEQHVAGALADLTSWTQPGDVYSFEPSTAGMHAEGLVEAAAAPSRTAEEIIATAADGTSVPVSVVHRTGIALDGSHPLVLRVAGAYGFSVTPNYDSVPEAWLARGGAYAVAHVRGGGELGERWHHAAMGASKSATWNDLIAAANRLIALGYTSPKRLDAYGTTQSYLGGIASSIAIGRAIEERPDLFAAAVVDVPVFDMLRSERTELGRQSISEFGSVATPAGFDALFAMSPYEHVVPGTSYPPLLVRSFAHVGRGDDWQAAKMVARLDAAAGGEGAAYFDSPFAAGDPRKRSDLNDDAFAFFLFEDGIGTARND